MNWLTLLKWLGPAVLLAGLGYVVLDWIDLREQDAAHERCIAASLDPAKDVEPCEPGLKGAITVMRRADVCDAALEPKARDRSGAKTRDEFALRASCSGATKRLFAELIAAEGDLADAQGQLARSDETLSDAVARAEARATAQATRKAANASTLAAAPRAADGRVACDAECLRALAAGTPGD
ncbi:hypothetical protein D1610_11575 [Sphingomonas gilva]|uniref:Uncharacterized protein n=1 Tax=Sphingomonas gilva TaxID=2305907 RepID=A0A396RPJ9_9SPHN|nr:hypothetical protein [Sphingomonas gilva]RHW17182.1 hypothetical protein D1610_11575 [Sphingomonas gilva]